MPRVVKKPGDVLQFPVEASLHSYAQWLPNSDVRVFSILTDTAWPIAGIVTLPVAFRVPILRRSPGLSGWSKVGNAPVPDEYLVKPCYAHQDRFSGAISIYENGVLRPATFDQAVDLEPLAVWEHPHIVDRLLATIHGRPSNFLESLRIKAA